MKRTHCLLSPPRFERGDNWCRAWWGALEKALLNERHNLRLPEPRRGVAFIPPTTPGLAPPILEASEWERELQGEALLHNATLYCFSLGARRRPRAYGASL